MKCSRIFICISRSECAISNFHQAQQDESPLSVVKGQNDGHGWRKFRFSKLVSSQFPPVTLPYLPARFRTGKWSWRIPPIQNETEIQ